MALHSPDRAAVRYNEYPLSVVSLVQLCQRGQNTFQEKIPVLAARRRFEIAGAPGGQFVSPTLLHLVDRQSGPFTDIDLAQTIVGAHDIETEFVRDDPGGLERSALRGRNDHVHLAFQPRGGFG
jgi:hypothetical protein